MNLSAKDFLISTVSTKHNEAVTAVENFVRIHYANAVTAAKDAALVKAISAMQDLQSVVHHNFRPPWLQATLSQLKRFQENPKAEHGIQAAFSVATVSLPAMKDHQWAFVDEQSGFDFDQIYEEAKATNQIPELFDEIVKWLKEIVESGEIDSVKLLNELKSIIATVKKARNGSYIANRHAWFFLIEWLKNTGWEAFGDIPVLGAPVKGLRTAIENTNKAMAKMHADMDVKLAESTQANLPKLTYDPPKLLAPRPESNGESPD